MQQSGLPMFYKNDPSTISDQIVWMVKNSQLNFQVQETAYSLNIQIKKRFLNNWNEVQNTNNLEQSLFHEHQISFLKSRNEDLEAKVNEALEKLGETKEKDKQALEDLEVKVNTFEIERGILLSELDKLRSKDIKSSSQLGDSMEAPVKTKKQKKKNIKSNSSASDFIEQVSDENIEEVIFLEPNVPTSNMFQKLENLNGDEFAIISVGNQPAKYSREKSTQQIITSSQDTSYTPPDTPQIRELAVQTTATDTNNNNSTDEPCSAADTLQELIAKNLRRLKAKM